MSKRLLVLLLGTLFLGLGTLVIAGNPSSPVVYIPAYYDAKLFTINFTELPPGSQTAIHDRNTQINTIYQSDELVDGAAFVSVLDAIQADGFNPLWEKVLIEFNAGFTPVQFFSDDEVLGAAAAGVITLTDTDEMYTCSVVGPK